MKTDAEGRDSAGRTEAMGSLFRRLQAAHDNAGMHAAMMDDCLAKSTQLLRQLEAEIRKRLPDATVTTDIEGTTSVDEDFFKMVQAQQLVVGAGSFATAAAIASKSGNVRSPACGETGCLWLNA